MSNEILFAIIQAATEFLPISSSGHLALLSNLIGEPNLFLITILHLASLFAVLIFTRKEIFEILKFKKESNKLLTYLIIATIPAGLFGLMFKSTIEQTFNSLLYIGLGFLLTGLILFLTKFAKTENRLNYKNALFIGLFQVLALFPGVSRSGMTISASIFFGIEREKATKFSFLLFIPLILGATVLEIGDAYFSIQLAIAFVLCFLLSLLFLNLLTYIVKKNEFWVFGIYTFVLGIISIGLYYL